MKGRTGVGRVLFLLTFIMCGFLAVSAWASETNDVHAAADNGVHGTADAGHAAMDTAHGEAAEGDTAAHGGSLSSEKLWDLLWRVINFAILVVILVYFGAKPIASGLSGRQKKIKNEIEDLESRRDLAEKSYHEFEEKLAGMEKEIGNIVERAIAQAEVEKVKIIEKAEQTAADIKRQAEMAIQNELMDARRRLKNDIADQATAMAEGLIKKNLTDIDQVKIIEDYLDKVGAVQ